MNEIPKIQGYAIADGTILIEPYMFGFGGKVFKEVAGDEAAANIADAMRELGRNYVPITKTNRRQLAELGLKEGIFYETGIPVSGKGEASDRERYKLRLESVLK